MASLTFQMPKRPCIIDGEKKAHFHNWVTESYMVEPNRYRGTPGGMVLKTRAIVEYEDGTVGSVSLHSIRFTDVVPSNMVVGP